MITLQQSVSINHDKTYRMSNLNKYIKVQILICNLRSIQNISLSFCSRNTWIQCIIFIDYVKADDPIKSLTNSFLFIFTNCCLLCELLLKKIINKLFNQLSDKLILCIKVKCSELYIPFTKGDNSKKSTGQIELVNVLYIKLNL